MFNFIIACRLLRLGGMLGAWVLEVESMVIRIAACGWIRGASGRVLVSKAMGETEC